MYGYIYKTTNLINGKIYIGQKKATKFLGEKYLGSGRVFKQAISKYGRENFKVELLEEIDCLEKMDEREIYWIAYFNATNGEIGYNRSEGGNVNRTMVGENNPFYGKHHSEETRKMMSEHNSRYMLGKHHSEETKQKIREKNLGKYVSDETRRKISEHNARARLGVEVSEEIKKKISEAKKGKPGKAKGKVHITNGVQDKMVYLNEVNNYLLDGWWLGRKKFSKEACENISKGHKGKSTYNKGYKWVNNGCIDKCVPQSELDNFLNNGWTMGMVHKIKD